MASYFVADPHGLLFSIMRVARPQAVQETKEGQGQKHGGAGRRYRNHPRQLQEGGTIHQKYFFVRKWIEKRENRLVDTHYAAIFSFLTFLLLARREGQDYRGSLEWASQVWTTTYSLLTDMDQETLLWFLKANQFTFFFFKFLMS
jgi:hypothetical protein